MAPLAGIPGVLNPHSHYCLLFVQKYNNPPEAEEKPRFTAEPFLNPLKELENNLNRLKDVPLQSSKQFEQFYIDLGDAIRLYFERMYSIPALESTSREIIYDLNRKMVDERLINQTRSVLREADMVKFAKFNPTKEHARKSYQEAEGFLSVARGLHRNRVQQMQRQHNAKVEHERAKFHENQKEEVKS